MTIKAKLITNVLVITAIIVGISLSSFFSMNFLQKNLAYLVEKSTPFQMRSMEFQRELQRCITGLTKVNTALNTPEYTKFRGEAEKSLLSVRYAQDSLKKMSTDSNSFTTSEELGQIANELFSAAEERIKSDMAAGEANTKISQHMKETTDRLKELEVNIHNLQATRAASFAQALKSTDRLSTTLLDLQELRNQVKDLISASSAAHNARNSTAFLIAKGKINSLLGRISKNESSSFIVSDLKAISANINIFLQHQATAVSQNNDDSKRIASDSLNELTEKITRLNLTLNQEIELDANRLRTETGRQEEIFRQSNIANTVSLANSELVALGFSVTGESNRLFTLGSTAELDKSASELSTLFDTIEERVKFIESSLSKLDAKNELKVLHNAYSSLAAIRSRLYSAEGIVTALKKKLAAIEQSNKSAETLQAIVMKQSAKGDENVATARSEQEKSIITVNSMVRRSMSQIIVIGAVAVSVGIFFGVWIYRSVLRPLRVVLNAVGKQQQLGEEKATLAEAVAGGDLDLEVKVSEAIKLDPAEIGDDEMGIALSAVVSMSEAQATLDRALAGMTASLRNSRDETTRRDHLRNGLYELNKILRIEHKTAEMADEALAFIADFIGAGVGIMYLYDGEGEMLQTLSTYAISKAGRLNWGFRLGEGLPGQVALERKMICLKAVPPDYLPISSALGQANPPNIAILPIMHNDSLAGVLELGSFKQFSDDDFDFLQQSMEGIAIAININRSRQLVNELLEESQAQAEELHAQQNELHQINEELEERARVLAERRK